MPLLMSPRQKMTSEKDQDWGREKITMSLQNPQNETFFQNFSIIPCEKYLWLQKSPIFKQRGSQSACCIYQFLSCWFFLKLKQLYILLFSRQSVNCQARNWFVDMHANKWIVQLLCCQLNKLESSEQTKKQKRKETFIVNLYCRMRFLLPLFLLCYVRRFV